ncbi:MAG TPA: imidazole glycerol phosphate synthase subunit HisH [Polyangiaceae bacterium]|nr:imidazole glycerol phosphate synthase subunit HisH [Polyangiaceae bacterium]
MKLTIVDYNGGNLRSVKRACHAVGIESDFTQDPEVVRRAERLIFPGVGNAQTAMETLNQLGLGEALREALGRGTPVLGICVGAQLILESSEESAIPCLGLLPGKTMRFSLADPTLKIPHIGWNEVRATRSHPLLASLQPGDEFYFVHSFFPRPANESDVYAVADYGGEFCCALGRDNLFATQFHPEKSGRLGLALLERFSRWDGSPVG